MKLLHLGPHFSEMFHVTWSSIIRKIVRQVKRRTCLDIYVDLNTVHREVGTGTTVKYAVGKHRGIT